MCSTLPISPPLTCPSSQLGLSNAYGGVDKIVAESGDEEGEAEIEEENHDDVRSIP